MRWLALLALPALLAAGGCNTDVGPSQAELRAQWDAQNSLPQNYKQDMLAFLRTYLNDPSGIRDGAVSPPVLKAVGQGQRYVACVRYNARDSRRQNTGVKTGAAVYVAGKLDRFLEGKEAQPYCKDAAFAPFPELARLTR